MRTALAAQKPEAEQTEPADNPSESAHQHDSTPSKKRSLPHPVARYFLFSWEFGLLRSAAGLKRDLQGSGLFAEAFREAISRFLKNAESEGVLEFSDSLAAKRELLRQSALMTLLGRSPASPCSVPESKARISD